LGSSHCSRSKGDGTIRIFDDYKVTVNPYLDIDRYPLPNPNDLFASLTSGQTFTELDLSQIYTQMPLASFPGLHAQLLLLAVQKVGGRSGQIYHMMRVAWMI